MLYRLYRPDDFAQLYPIEEICFQPPHRFSRAYIRQLVSSAQAATWVAEESGRLVGFAIVEWGSESGETIAYIQTIEVAPEGRRRGTGAELMRRIEDSARQAGAELIWLHVDAENRPAITLYQSHGYLCRGREENYYGRGRAGLVYAKRLTAGEPTEQA
ncbi:MAG TPA: N-acetyltransferase [Terracidiphilus sp.]|nr:N-acetyltransferase [Terracidiphilus sp.]